MTIDAHLTQKHLSKRGKTMQKYKQQILEPNLCSHHRKTPLLFRPHHSGCQKNCFFFPLQKTNYFLRREEEEEEEGFVYERAPQKAHRKTHCRPEPEHNASRLFPTDKEALVSPSPERKKKQRKPGDDLVPVALKKDWKQKPL